MFVYTEYHYISGNHRKYEVEARNLEELAKEMIPKLGLSENSTLCTSWNKELGGWNGNWKVETSFGVMQVRDCFIEKY